MNGAVEYVSDIEPWTLNACIVLRIFVLLVLYVQMGPKKLMVFE